MPLIRIIGMPRGEAPEEIRRAWVGIVLPLPPGRAERRQYRVTGVLTGPKGFWKTWAALLTGRLEKWDGYVVDAETAIEALETQAPDAAAWWRQHVPHLLKPGRFLLFSAEACEYED